MYRHYCSFSVGNSLTAVRQGRPSKGKSAVNRPTHFASYQHFHACHDLETQVVMTKATPAPGVVEEKGVFKMQYNQK